MSALPKPQETTPVLTPAELTRRRETSSFWFRMLRDDICDAFEQLEEEAAAIGLYNGKPGRFKRTHWQREEGGGGEMSLMRGLAFEKVGVNISGVWGTFSEQFRREMPGGEKMPCFFATGISLVAHMANPHVPAVHMNTRFIATGDRPVVAERNSVFQEPPGEPSYKSWFGGGADLTPVFENKEIESQFHGAFRATCGRHTPGDYDKYKKWCDEYFFIKHRGEARGAGGIFYDYLVSEDWEADFAFTQDVGKTFLEIYPELVRQTMQTPWSEEDRQAQRLKRARYVEFNLLYDRGTRFGLMTGGNPEAILMSMPPEAVWP